MAASPASHTRTITSTRFGYESSLKGFVSCTGRSACSNAHLAANNMFLAALVLAAAVVTAGEPVPDDGLALALLDRRVHFQGGS